MSKGAFKIIKILTRMLLGLIVLTLSLVIIIPVATYFFFDPNDYRSQIASFISQKTDLPLTINGQIDFQLFPWFGLKVQKLDLFSPAHKEHFIQIEEIGFQIPLQELMRSHFQIESLFIKGLQVNLMKYSNGAANWDYLSKKINQSPPDKNATSPAFPTKDPSTQKKLKFNITNFNIENATIYYHDQQENQLIILDKLQLQGKNEKEMIYPVKGKFELILQKAQDKKPLLKGSGEFTGKALLASKTLMANLQTYFTGQAAILDQQLLHLSSQLEINPASAIHFKNVNLKTGQMQLTGKFTVPVDSQAPITFNFNVNKLDLDQINLAQNLPATPSFAHAPSNFKYIKASQKSPVLKKTTGRTLMGNIHIAQVIAKNLMLTEVKSHLKKEGAFLKLDGIQAILYQGNLSGSLSKELGNLQSSTYFQGSIQDVQIQPLLKDLKKPDKLRGAATANFNMSYHAQHGFNGVTRFQIKQGTYQGIDVNYYLELAKSLLKKAPVAAPNTKMTPFDNLSGTLNFHENILHNPDLQLISKDFRANGEGSINLTTQAIAYKLQALKQYEDNKEHPNAYPLALRIRGTIEHPIAEPDLDLYLKEALKREATKQINKQLEKQLGKLLGADKAAEKNTSEEASDQDPSAKNKLQEKIEKEVGKGLKKILGF